MAWTQKGNLKGPKGDAGSSVQLRVDSGYVQWKQDGAGGSWANLISVAALTGPAGEGIEIAGSVATYANLPGGLGGGDVGKGYLVEADGLLYIWDGTKFPASGSGVAFQGPPGDAGINGKEVELQTTGSHIQWRLDGQAWTNLIALSVLTGAKGDKGDDGGDGDDGKGWTNGTYNPADGKVTFSSSDGLGFSTGDLRGTNGVDGNRWFAGHGSPSGVGGSSVGDYYLDLASGDVYELN